jgi:regulator of ribonuclease activity A
MIFKTADLCDQYPDQVQVCEPGFSSFGGRSRFSGVISTLKCFEDNSLVREAVAEPGRGRVLVVDAGGSRRCAMLGDLLAAKAADNGWAGVLMYGMIRDSVEIGAMELGVMALGTHPRKSEKRGVGQRDVTVGFAGVRFEPGHYLYADEDGILCSPVPLAGGPG